MGLSIGNNLGLAQNNMGRRFSPDSLFTSGEVGDWFDASDLSRMWQDTAGTTPITADGQSVARIDGQRGLVSLRQSTPGSMPLYKTSGDLHWLQLDGTDDFLVSNASIDPGLANKAQMFAGVLVASPRINNAAVYEFGDSTASASDAMLRLQTGDGSTDSYRAYMTGTANNLTLRITKLVPYTVVFSTLFDASQTGAGEISLRENGAVTGVGSATDSGVTSFGAQVLNVGQRNGSVGRFGGNIYSLIVRFSAENLDASRISAAERWTAARCGVTL